MDYRKGVDIGKTEPGEADSPDAHDFGAEELSEANPVASAKPVGRRVFLALVGTGVVGTVFGERISALVGSIVRPVTNSSGGGIAALIPGAERFRIYTVTGNYPSISAKRYSLLVGGLVERPLLLSYNDLLALPRAQFTKDFQCVTGWRVPGVEWAGVLLRDVIDAAGPRPGAKAVEFTSYDGVYTESLTIAEARRGDVMVAYEMLGAPISAEHGGPVRLYVAPMYGYKSAKWLASISLVGEAAPGFWEQQGYDVEAWIGSSNGRHDAPVA